MTVMSEPHRIRLRAPWRFSAADAAAEPADQRWESPSAWQSALGMSFRGLACCTRIFHAPRQLPDSEELWLVIAWPPAAGRLLLNGVELGPLELGVPTVAYEITAAIGQQNEIALELALPPLGEDQSSAACQVWLEFRPQSQSPRLVSRGMAG